MTRLWKTVVPALSTALLMAGCVVGPNYQKPLTADTPPLAFKEAPPEGFQQAQPSDAIQKGKWWEIYQDPQLNDLEEQVLISNQNLASVEAQYREAKAAILAARAGLYPTVTATPSITESQSSTTSGSGKIGSTFNLPVGATWEPDLWGNIRRSITAARASSQVTYADLENARLSFQATLATDYFQLHGIDSELDLLNHTAESYMQYLTLTQNRFTAGVASDLDVAQAESQLDNTQSTIIDLGIQRAQLEHAVAMLTGKSPGQLSIPVAVLTAPPPPLPIGVPSELLERRPDIAASERLVAVANEQIGIAMAAFYPTLTLGASGGFNSTSFLKWFELPSRVWSVGPQLAETLFEGGRRKAVVAEQQAAYDATVANYRQTVLVAFQQVEDSIASLRILEQEAAKVSQTTQAANRALTVSTAQYKAGTTAYLTVITEQAVLLNSQDTAVQLLTRRLISSVSLIEALGGGWNVSKLPTTTQKN